MGLACGFSWRGVLAGWLICWRAFACWLLACLLFLEVFMHVIPVGVNRKCNKIKYLSDLLGNQTRLFYLERGCLLVWQRLACGESSPLMGALGRMILEKTNLISHDTRQYATSLGQRA
jgi:hypothetical protein